MQNGLIPSQFYTKKPHVLRETERGKLFWNTIPKKIQDLRERICKKTVFKDIVPLDTTNKWGIFASELDDDGARTFFTAEYDDLFYYFKLGFPRHFYEVIEYDKPCNLYYDVEYKYAEKTLPGDKLVEEIIDMSKQCLKTLFLVDDVNVVVLKSDSKVKFSRHIIISSKTKAFKSNFHVGKFVRDNILIYEKFQEIVDPGVYSKNRCLRLIWNSKIARGYEDKLIPLDDTNSIPQTSTPEFFASTLASNAKGLSLIGYPDIDPTKPNGIANPHVNPLGEVDVKCSDLDDFCIKAFAPTGFIKRADYNDHFNTILMTVSGCRYCQRIGREHKSNSIYIVVKLSSGVAVQKCYDPDCQGFESIPVPVPPQILDTIRRKYDKFYKGYNKQPINTNNNVPESGNKVIDINPNLPQPEREKPIKKEFRYLSSSSSYESSDEDSIIEE